MDTDISVMERKKKKPKSDGSPTERYRKPSTPVRIRKPLAEAAEASAIGLAQDLTQWVNDAVRERLERLQLWPPPKSSK